MDPSDLELFNKFMPAAHDEALPLLNNNDQNESSTSGVNLADLILEQIAAHEAGQQSHDAVQRNDLLEKAIELPAKVVEVYSKYSISS